jgi:two-component system, NarL family, nitrate/nitrite response regulator NarL
MPGSRISPGGVFLLCRNEHSLSAATSDSPENPNPKLLVVPRRKPGRAVRIVIVDEQTILRHSLRALLDGQPGLRVVGEAADSNAAIALARRLEPDVLILDVAMADMTGMEVLRELGKTNLKLRVVVLSAALGKAHTVRAIELGARAIVLKNSSSDQLLEAIRKVMQGEYCVANESLANLIQAVTENSTGKRKFQNRYGLTARESEMVGSVLKGYSNPEIADNHHVSEQTVKHHLSNVFDKLGVFSRLELALFAVNHHIFEDASDRAAAPSPKSAAGSS